MIIDKFLELYTNKKTQSFMISLSSVIVSLFFGCIIFWILGKNPFTAYGAFLRGSGILPKFKYGSYQGQLTDILRLLDAITPMIFAALAVAVAYVGGMFNIAVSGIMLLSGFIATITIGYIPDLNPFIAKPLVVLVGVLMGVLYGTAIGYLKYKFNINEVVTAIMFNYITMYIVGFFIQSYYIDTVSRQSKNITDNSRLTLQGVEAFGLKFVMPLGIVLALIFVFVIWFIMNRTKLGFEIKALGSNKNAAKYSGININKMTLLIMAISGGIAGIAGVTYYLGYYDSMAFNQLNTLGFSAISVSLLGNNNPVGIIFSSLLITIIDTGSTYMSSYIKVEREIAGVLTSIILIFTACATFFKYKINRIVEERELEKPKAEGVNLDE
ncbi:MAG: ABC transporter permease [Lachnospirales bacterium]